MRFNVGASNNETPLVTSPNLPSDHPPIGSSSADACPVDDKTRSRWLSLANLTSSSSSSSSPSSSSPPPNSPSGSGSASFQSGAAGSRQANLSRDREISSIPRAPIGTTPVHVGSSEGAGSDDDKHWVYPSELQFFQAMARKNHSPKEGDMRSVVGIHNAVNEKAWEMVLLWEQGMGSEPCGGPRLISFAGIPTKRSPKSYLYMALGYSAPFDRHDWIIDRCGTNVRYVIDFYSGKQDPNDPAKSSFFIDVRPAIDTKVGIQTRLIGIWKYYVAGYGA
ncbi:cytochrome c/c1 heme-lyase [Kockovaella imperatae]|uniref:Holocytochrome c-type synthase n=1 Tax=Kockovaella imperatae TaxID=4999 RepID=A0A1Y1UFT9_9TREE|nr:cytochrome c/c1 heme-lyase [Kockovaella imperatae]ORX36882.1 cytochrome c/c1 heme-lyase [Kockovaella imperatae]